MPISGPPFSTSTELIPATVIEFQLFPKFQVLQVELLPKTFAFSETSCTSFLIQVELFPKTFAFSETSCTSSLISGCWRTLGAGAGYSPFSFAQPSYPSGNLSTRVCIKSIQLNSASVPLITLPWSLMRLGYTYLFLYRISPG